MLLFLSAAGWRTCSGESAVRWQVAFLLKNVLQRWL
jgi:hypothetical protein